MVIPRFPELLFSAVVFSNDEALFDNVIVK